MKKIIIDIAIAILLFFIVFIVIDIIYNFLFNQTINWSLFVAGFSSWYLWLFDLLVIAGCIWFYFYKFYKFDRGSKKKHSSSTIKGFWSYKNFDNYSKSNIVANQKHNAYGFVIESKALTVSQQRKCVKKNSFEKYADVTTQKTLTCDFRKHKINKNYTARLLADSNCILYGTSGSGKTATILLPTIELNVKSTIKPSMIITDPKGEIFDKTSAFAKKNGYDVLVYNYYDSFNSNSINLLDFAFSKFKNYLLLKNNRIKRRIHTSKIDNYIWIDNKPSSADTENPYFTIGNFAFISKDSARQQSILLSEQEKSKAFDECDKIATKFCQSRDNDKQADGYWEPSTIKLVLGWLLRALEKIELDFIENGEINNTYFNLPTIAKNIDLTTAESVIEFYDDRKNQLKNWTINHNKLLKKLNELNDDDKKDNKAIEEIEVKIQELINKKIIDYSSDQMVSVYNESPKALGTIKGMAGNAFKPFKNIGIIWNSLISDSSFDTIEIRPTIIYIIIPEVDTTKHVFASILVEIMYATLLDKCNNYLDQKLPRPILFILEEFGNLPKIDIMNSLLTAGRSRNIWTIMAIQADSQINLKYGRDTAEILKANVMATLYLLSDDYNTNKRLSDTSGKIDYFKSNSTTSIGIDKESLNKSYQDQENEKLVIKPEDLRTNKENNLYLWIQRKKPIKNIEVINLFQTVDVIKGCIPKIINQNITNDWTTSYFLDLINFKTVKEKKADKKQEDNKKKKLDDKKKLEDKVKNQAKQKEANKKSKDNKNDFKAMDGR